MMWQQVINEVTAAARFVGVPVEDFKVIVPHSYGAGHTIERVAVDAATRTVRLLRK